MSGQLIGPIGVLPAPVVVTTTAWNPSDRADSLNQVLSNGGLTVTQTAAGTDGIRAISAQTTGLRYFEIVYTASPSGIGNNAVGIANSSAVLTFPGNDANAIGMTGAGTVFIALGSAGLSGVPFAVGDVVGIMADLGAKKVWYKNVTTGSGWNNDILANQNPTVGSQAGGNAFTFSGPYLPMANGAASGDVFTANFGATAYALGSIASFGAINW